MRLLYIRVVKSREGKAISDKIQQLHNRKRT